MADFNRLHPQYTRTGVEPTAFARLLVNVLRENDFSVRGLANTIDVKESCLRGWLYENRLPRADQLHTVWLRVNSLLPLPHYVDAETMMRVLAGGAQLHFIGEE